MEIFTVNYFTAVELPTIYEYFPYKSQIQIIPWVYKTFETYQVYFIMIAF